MNDKNEVRSDLRLDLENEDVHKKAKENFDTDKDLLLTVLSALNTEKITAVREIQ